MGPTLHFHFLVAAAHSSFVSSAGYDHSRAADAVAHQQRDGFYARQAAEQLRDVPGQAKFIRQERGSSSPIKRGGGGWAPICKGLCPGCHGRERGLATRTARLGASSDARSLAGCGSRGGLGEADDRQAGTPWECSRLDERLGRGGEDGARTLGGSKGLRRGEHDVLAVCDGETRNRGFAREREEEVGETGVRGRGNGENCRTARMAWAVRDFWGRRTEPRRRWDDHVACTHALVA